MSRTSKTRPNDFYYDQSFISSGPKDYYKQAINARQAMMNFVVCPIFPSMFSDLQNYPCKQYVIRRPPPIPAYHDKINDLSQSRISRAIITGSDRYKYFHNSPSSHATKKVGQEVPALNLTCFYEIDKIRKEEERRKTRKKTLGKSVKIQTLYRETSAQTSPWQPDYTVISGDPELLKLDFLKWGEGLPAGKAEIEYIDRMRHKSKFESLIPEGHSDEDFLKKRDMIDELNRIEWANRERDIDEMHALRLELLEKMLNEIHAKSNCRNNQKLRMFVDNKIAEKQEKIDKVQKEAQREKRRITFQFRGILKRYRGMDAYEENANNSSELYCPLMRNGTNPKYRHLVLSKPDKKFKPQYCNVEMYNTIPRHLSRATKIGEIKLKGTRLCIKETKWTLPVLKLLYEELKELRVDKQQHPNLRVCVEKASPTIPTPEIPASRNEFTEVDKAAVFLQKVLRGRAAQNKIFMGRERCHELIDELRGNYALLKGDVCKKARIREKRKEEQLNATRCMLNMKALESSLKKLSGCVTGSLLDFLNKDLQRLLRERRAHAMILLVERLRAIREAEEAGRRQKEIRRRQEHDEMFKQVVKVHQDTVDMYLQDVITEGMKFATEEKAKEYVNNLTMKMDQEQREIEESTQQIEREEYIASMVQHFVIPEVEKNIVRDRMRKNQAVHLRNAHNEIYKNIENLPKPETPESSVVVESQTSTDLVGEATIDDMIRQSSINERQNVIDDVRAILDELIEVPYKESILEKLVPCTIEEMHEESSTLSALDLEEHEGDKDVELTDDEKFETVESIGGDSSEKRIGDLDTVNTPTIEG